MYLTDYMFSQLYPNLVFEQQTDNEMQAVPAEPMPQGDPSPVNPMEHPDMAGGMDPNQFQQGPPGEAFGGGDEDFDGGDGSNGAIEFENIKRYILYGKLKDLKHRLEMSDIDNNDPAVKSIMEFIDLVTVFYNTFTYEDTVKLFDSLIDSISDELKIKLPSRLDNLEDEDEIPEGPETQPEAPIPE